MEQQIFSLKDEKISSFTKPFHVNHKGEAIRALDAAVQDLKTNVNQYPSDFTLYQLGTFDDQTGKFTNSETPELVASATDFIKTKE